MAAPLLSLPLELLKGRLPPQTKRRPPKASQRSWEDHVRTRERSERTIAAAAEEWLPGLSDVTRVDAGSFVRAHLVPSFGRRLCSSIGDLEMEAWIAARLADDPPYEPATITKLLSTFSRFFVWSVAKGYAAQNPVPEVSKRFRLGRAPQSPMERKLGVLDVEQYSRFLYAPELTDVELWLFATGILTGCRIGELTGLERRHWFRCMPPYGRGRAPLDALIVEQQWHTKLRRRTLPKDRTWRIIPVRPELSMLLEARDRWFLRTTGSIDDHDPLLPFVPTRFNRDRYGTWRRWNQRTALKYFTRALIRVGIDDGIRRDSHTMRHVFCSALDNAGVEESVQRTLTHPLTAEDRRDAHKAYIHKYWSTLCEAIMQIPIVAPPKSEQHPLYRGAR